MVRPFMIAAAESGLAEQAIHDAAIILALLIADEPVLYSSSLQTIPAALAAPMNHGRSALEFVI